MELETKWGEVKIFAQTIENEAMSQIIQMANSPLGENADIRIMPDCHAGAGCVIGTTMKITDKVCPNLVGVDIGCGVTFIKTNIDFKNNLDKLDNIIRQYIPFGMATHTTRKDYDFTQLKCWDKLKKETQEIAMTSLGTLGGGNHFIEAYENGCLAVHSGSRNIGWRVAEYYQKLAEKTLINKQCLIRKKMLEEIEPKQREQWLKEHQIHINSELCYLEDGDMKDYLHDIKIMQQFASDNRHTMLQIIMRHMNGVIQNEINSIHNYIDTDNMILRKGAISAQKDEILVIPLNMKDGILICRGKGNADWNYSAPHGAGRLYSRSQAKEIFSVEEYQKSMEGIYSTCINSSTLDEAPFVYKNYEEIMNCVEPTVDILERIKPIYNFKAN